VAGAVDSAEDIAFAAHVDDARIREVGTTQYIVTRCALLQLFWPSLSAEDTGEQQAKRQLAKNGKRHGGNKEKC